jgi:hypothetical protein
MLPQFVVSHPITEQDNQCPSAPHIHKEFKCPGHNSENQILIRYNPPTIPKNPTMIAGQVPAGKLADAPLPLNERKEAVGDGIPLLARSVSPPVRFAPLGYRE